MKRYYLAYGSNLNLEQMKKRCKDSKLIGKTVLYNYRLVYKGINDNVAYLTIEPEEGCFVPLGIFRISKKDEETLDIYENYPRFYEKMYIPIFIKGKIYMAMLYIMKLNFNYYLPSKDYVDACLQGYLDFGFDSYLLDDAFSYSKKQRDLVLERNMAK